MSDRLAWGLVAAGAYVILFVLLLQLVTRSPELDPRDEAGMDDDQREALRIIHNGEDH